MVPLSLGERKSRMLEYFRREDPQLSCVLNSIMLHAFANADPICSTLALWASDACGGDSESALAVSTAVECLYRFALLHDELHDLPVPQPGAEKTASVWGLAQTLNAGDACHGLALKLIAAKSPHPARTLAVAIMLEEDVLQAIEHRSRLIRIVKHGPRRGARRRAYSGARALALSTSLRAGAMIAGAPDAVVQALSKAGHRLDIALQLASSRPGPGKSYVAQRYAAAAVQEVRQAGLDPAYVHEFEEIAHQLAAGD